MGKKISVFNPLLLFTNLMCCLNKNDGKFSAESWLAATAKADAEYFNQIKGLV